MKVKTPELTGNLLPTGPVDGFVHVGEGTVSHLLDELETFQTLKKIPITLHRSALTSKYLPTPSHSRGSWASSPSVPSLP
jgi:hypothetical protein